MQSGISQTYPLSIHATRGKVITGSPEIPTGKKEKVRKREAQRSGQVAKRAAFQKQADWQRLVKVKATLPAHSREEPGAPPSTTFLPHIWQHRWGKCRRLGLI
ncbi:hypothetical protein CEXT_798221 [Caerostris extrusa]|uniref:Uncharacterized protein n=1 Tax=Caerostris extrusa TaxID=172846 RepID=A0AAV4V8J5_CAEEX|nr:hypothetical protein CEXT_798221 [Caerostris extrusa]